MAAAGHCGSESAQQWCRKKDLNFYEGKMFTLRYFFGYELPKTLGLAKRLMEGDRLTVEMQTGYFND